MPPIPKIASYGYRGRKARWQHRSGFLRPCLQIKQIEITVLGILTIRSPKIFLANIVLDFLRADKFQTFGICFATVDESCSLLCKTEQPMADQFMGNAAVNPEHDRKRRVLNN